MPHDPTTMPIGKLAKYGYFEEFCRRAATIRDAPSCTAQPTGGTVAAVKWLLRNGADPNALDEGGRTPLHVCAERNTSTTVLDC